MGCCAQCCRNRRPGTAVSGNTDGSWNTAAHAGCHRDGPVLAIRLTDPLSVDGKLDEATIGAGFPGLKNRAFVVKINRLFRF